MSISDKFCQIDDAADAIGCTRARVRQLLLDGELKGEKVSKARNAPWMIERKSVAKYAAQEQSVGRKRTGEKQAG